MSILNRLFYPFTRPSPPPMRQTMGFFTDTSLCIGCKACEVACKQWNQIPANQEHWTGHSYDNNSNGLSSSNWRHVNFREQFNPPNHSSNALRPAASVPGGYSPGSDAQSILELLASEPKDGRWLMMSDVCKHCTVAPCQLACPTGAIVYTEFGNVYIQDDICNGCGYCVAACPFGVITRSENDGHAHKCTLCFDRQREGLTPACAKACPTESIQFGPIDELHQRAVKRVEQLHARGQTDAYLYGMARTGTYSSMRAFFLLLDSPELYGLPAAPSLPQLNLRSDFIRMALGIIVTIAAICLVFMAQANVL
jgi:formate dehydrogenase iron-sulfur subunit